MSIRSCLKTLKPTRKSFNLLREIPPSISKTLDSSDPSIAADFSDLTPSKLLQILSHPAVKPSECLHFFNSVIENQSSVSFVPDLQANLTLIGRLLNGKRFTEAEHLLKGLTVDQIERYPFPVVASSVENLENLKPRVVGKLFNVMMNVYSVNERFEQVLESFDYMERNGIEIDERTCTLHLIVLKKRGEMKMVMEFFHRMIRSSGIKISPYSLSVVVSGMCENGEVRMCREFIEEMIRNGINPNVVTYNIMLNACIRRWNFAEVETILGLMKKEETGFDEKTYKMMIDGYTSCGKFEEAEGMVLEMNDKGFGGGGEIHLWNPIITGYCKKGFVEKAALLFDKMDSRGVTPNAETYQQLINAHCREGNVEASMVYVSKMVKDGFNLDEATLKMLLVDGFCSRGMASEACDLLVEMVGSGLVVDVDVSICNEVGRQLCVSNQFDKAKVLVDMMAEKNDAAAMLGMESKCSSFRPDIPEPVLAADATGD
ncbi:Pentatricopeptide repeat-containing protein At2g28050 [Linum perenne]